MSRRAPDQVMDSAPSRRKITGKFLDRYWGIGAKHTLYSHDGTWYHQLRRFPGAYCDSEGYILFSTKSAFLDCSFLRIRKDVGCPEGIRRIPGYVRCESQAANDIGLPAQSERVLQHISRIVRDTALGSELKLLYGHACQLCGTVIMLCGRAYSEAHHIRPLGRPHDGSDTRGNLLCVCPNCHVLLDYAAIPIRIDGLRTLKHGIEASNISYHNMLHATALSRLKV